MKNLDSGFYSMAFALLLTVCLLFSSCKKDDDFNDSIIGSWTLQSQSYSAACDEDNLTYSSTPCTIESEVGCVYQIIEFAADSTFTTSFTETYLDDDTGEKDVYTDGDSGTYQDNDGIITFCLPAPDCTEDGTYTLTDGGNTSTIVETFEDCIETVVFTRN